MAGRGRLLLSCEHGGNRIPRRYAARFAGRERLLAGHCGFDLGALRLARQLARRLRAPLHATTVSRLLVDTNRSLHHPDLFSPISVGLPGPERRRVLERYYHPHRDAIEGAVAQAVGRAGSVLHVAVHSFSPGTDRRCDVGLLYDPRRPGERALCARWRALLGELAPRLRVRRNHPYRGAADGLTTHLRRRFGRRAYRGIEVEVSQRHLARGAASARAMGELLGESLARLVGNPAGRGPGGA